MKTFYSILYCTIRPNLDERVSIGLFIGNDETCKFSYSADKLTVIRGLFSASAFNLLKTTLKSLEKLATECEEDFLDSYKGKSVLKEQYFSYLSRYANNLITFSQPAPIDVDLNTAVFEKFFEKFIYQLPRPVEHVSKPIASVRKRLSGSIATHVNFNAEIDYNTIPGLLVPAKVWFIGQNEVTVTGEAKDFSSLRPDIIQQQINAHLHLIDKIKETKRGKLGKFFLIGDEPTKSHFENHRLWEAVKVSSTLDLVPTNEIEKVEKYMQEHGVAPLF